MHHINPWLSIWIRPRAAIASIVSEHPNRGIWVLAWVYGFLSLLNAFQTVDLGHTLSLVPILFLAIFLAPLWGMAVFTIWSALVYWIGKVIGGTGTFKGVRAAYAWSCVPLVVSILIWIVLLAYFGSALFLSSFGNAPMPNSQIALLFAMLIAKTVLAIWSLVIFINALAEVQNYSVFRAICNVVLAWVVMGVVIGLLWWGLFAGRLAELPQSQMLFSLWQF